MALMEGASGLLVRQLSALRRYGNEAQATVASASSAQHRLATMDDLGIARGSGFDMDVPHQSEDEGSSMAGRHGGRP